MKRLYLSPPHMNGTEQDLVDEAFTSNWIAPLGPHVDAFEREMCRKIGMAHACALSSGTAGLHLALLLLGVGRGDSVWCSSLTFAASANAVAYVGAIPVFIDSERRSWNMDPDLLAQELEDASRRGELPRAVITVDLYGQCADYDSIGECCTRYEVPMIEDAAEALGATYHGAHAGSFGEMSVLSFNGNKIITTGGGGMLLANDEKYTKRALHLATQARDPAPYYQHSEIGYNYRLSNILAAIGRGQLVALEEKVAARRQNFNRYAEALGDVPGLELQPEADYGRHNRWLTCMTIDEEVFGASPETIRLHLAELKIEARPVWKPMHMQPVFSECRAIGGDVAEDLFMRGLCLPSGSQMTEDDIGRVVSGVMSTTKGNG